MSVLSALLHLGKASKRFPMRSYAEYVETQNAGNARKVHLVFTKRANIAHVSRYIVNRCGPSPRILCHGTRNGAELRYFKDAIPGASVLGTDIADSASQFPDTIQWDFHEVRDEWVGAWDVVYTNSWDHAFDPERALKNWMQSLTPNGLLILEHSRLHMPDKVRPLDPFGATIKGLTTLVNDIGSPNWSVIEVITDLPDRKFRQKMVLVGRS